MSAREALASRCGIEQAFKISSIPSTVCFHWLTYPKVAAWNQGPTPFAARFAGGRSLVLWTIRVAAGRWIGMTT
jgi:hypothetical protein